MLEASKDTTSFAAREADSRDQYGTLRRRVSLNFKLLPEDSWLAEECRPRPHAAEVIFDRRRCKTALMI